MAIPKAIRPENSTTIPSTGKRIKYQPFSVKEEKVLVLAAESEDLDEISNAIGNVLKNCVTSPADINVHELALFDIEYLFLKCRSKSAGEKITVKVTDPADETYVVDHDILIDKNQIQKTKGHTNIIDISDTVKIKMRYPDIDFFTEGVNIDNVAQGIETISRCVEQIVVDEEVYNREDMTTQEITEWLEGLTTEQFTKLNQFFVTMPKLRHEINLTNKRTGEPFTIVLEGLSDFF